MLRLLSIIILSCFLFTTNALPVAAANNYTYDQNGNMTQSGTHCFEYNEANQMHRVKNCADNKTIAEYIYDHSGKRLVKKEYENGVLKQTIYSPTDEYEAKKIEGGATENTVYYKANSEVIAKKNPDGTINYYHNDHLGSTTVLTDQSGNMIEKSAYEPYGEIKQGGTKSKYGYTGQEKDSETGLNYYDARYYDPHLQRFIQPDTLLPDIYDPQQLNRYAYARNNPLKYTDPTGNFLFVPVILAVAARVAMVAIPAIVKAVSSPAVRNIATSAINNVKNLPSAALNIGKSVASSFGNSAKTISSNAGNSSMPSTLNIGNNSNQIINNLGGQSTTLRGTHNPIVQNAAEFGKQMHKNFQYPSGYRTEVTLDSGKRVDALNDALKHIIELKPNTPGAIRKGEKQIEMYLDELNNGKEGIWTGDVWTYLKP